MEETRAMNCLEFRRRVASEPRRLDAGLRAHRAQCEDCAEHHAYLLALESELEQALCVPVPEGLADRVLLAGSRGASRRSLYALAAGMVLAVGIATAVLVERAVPNPALAAIDHVLEDEVVEIAVGRRGDAGVMRAALAAAGVSVPEDGFDVRYLGICPFRGSYAHHVMLSTPFGRATLLFNPDQPMGSTVVADGRGLSALVAPVRTGSLALVAGNRDAAARIRELILR